MLVLTNRPLRGFTEEQVVREVTSFQRVPAEAQVRSARGEWAEAVRLWERVVASNPVNGEY